jgi:ferredoxin
MAYIITDACVKCKYTDCVVGCPAQCFHEGEIFVVIDPDRCIDCGICETLCPIEAIKYQTEDDADGRWISINRQYAAIWPRINTRKEPLPGAEEMKVELNKFERYLGAAADDGDAAKRTY